MSEFSAPDSFPEYFVDPVVEVYEDYVRKTYADGVAVIETGVGDERDIETRYPDRGIHYEQGPDGRPQYIAKAIPEDADV